MRKTGSAGLSLIKTYEGCRLTAYNATGSEPNLTIGYGHCGSDVTPGMKITQAQADYMLANDLAKFEKYVNNPVYVPVTAQLNQNQFDALVSFSYNCGAGNLQALCKGRTIAQIADHITAYNKGGGEVLAGLMKRRAAELELFNKPVTEVEDEDKMKLTDYEWNTLESQVKAMLDKKTINDPTWLAKVKDRTLTAGELAWLSLQVAMR